MREGASILMCLKYKNATNIDYKTFLDRMPISPDNNPFNGFAGSPYTAWFLIYFKAYFLKP